MSNTVFVLGAGASKEAGAPLMADFLEVADEIRARKNLIGQYTLDRFNQIFEARGSLQSIFSKADLDIHNIESLFAAFEMIDLLGLDIAGADSKSLKSAMRDFITQTLDLK